MNKEENLSYEDLRKLYDKHFSLRFLGEDLSNKCAVIALTCYITNSLRKKNPEVTCLDVLHKIYKNYEGGTDKYLLQPLSIICEDFMFGCEQYPTFNVNPKDMPKQVKNILDLYLPF